MKKPKLHPDQEKNLNNAFILGQNIASNIYHLKKLSTLDEFYDRMAEKIDDIHKEVDIKSHIQCGRQECSFCCHAKIMVSRSEADRIINYVKANNIQVNKIKIQSEENWDSLTFSERACPLLLDGKCSIYEKRPILCRQHNITKGEDVENCKRDNEDFYMDTITVPSVDALMVADILTSEPCILNYELQKL